MKRNRKESGFSLIELLIVMGIMGVLAAILVPGLLRSRAAANSRNALSSLRNLQTAQNTHLNDYDTFGPISGATGLSTRGLFNPGTVTTRSTRDEWTMTGYRFSSSAGTTTAWNAVAIPTAFGQSGPVNFYADQSNSIRFVNTEVAGADINAKVDTAVGAGAGWAVYRGSYQ